MTEKPPRHENFDPKTPKIKLGGLWKKQDSQGRDYLVGELQFGRMLIFINEDKYKEGAHPKSPDFLMYVAQGLPTPRKRRFKGKENGE